MAMPDFPFHFDLPPERIAQFPVEPRDSSRLMVVDRARDTISHRRFFELPEFLRPGDLLILNNTRVLHARLLGRRGTGGKWEGLFLRQFEDGTWEMLCQAGGRLRTGETIAIDPAPLRVVLVEKLDAGRWRVRPELSEEGSPSSREVPELLERFGRVPLPPYIRKGKAEETDKARYQTVFAQQQGSVAAPTAGLHFTPTLLDRLHEKGIAWRFVTLHVGIGTFQPIQAEDYTQHTMHAEWGELSSDTAEAIRRCKEAGGRIIAVGTTSVRVLETAGQIGPLQAWRGETSIYIHPPFSFRVVDGLITNFHLPRTTLLLLVAALTGSSLLQRAYASAIAEDYRFFSYGDAMFIA